ncbi:hypothetical protein N9X54_01175 [Planktomarina temperata]|nr:hypothetical protein [Planktomarina temperata]
MTTLVNQGNYQYPAPKLIQLRGVWVVKVSIPAHMRHLFGNGKGTTRDRRKSTKTKDYKIAKSREYELTQIIYNEFDSKLKEETDRHDHLADEYAIAAITGLAESFKYKNIPIIKPTTEYIRLEKLKLSCDAYAEMVFNDSTEDQVSKLYDLLSSDLKPEEFLAEGKRLLEFSSYTSEQLTLAGRYRTKFVHSYWQDLLLTAAFQQGLPEPSLKPFEGAKMGYGIVGNEITPDHPIIRNFAENLYGQPMKNIDRPARVVPIGALTISSVMQDYLADMGMKQKNIDTQRKLKRWVEQFHRVMGDLEISAIKPKHGYDYIRAILTDYPNRSNKTLKDYVWGVQNFLKYCLENGFIDVNPFTGLDLSKYGEASEETYAFSREDLKNIFSYDWKPQERLFLSILATTGMRPSEVGNLTWERFNDTEYAGIRYFTLMNTNDELVQVKNQSSRREVPLHPALDLPIKSSGRLFNYTKDDVGLSSTAAGHLINPVIRALVVHQNKSIRSFRRTFKTMLRDLSVGEEVHDAITGHTIPSASRKNYGGMGMQVKFDAISKLDISFL